MHFELLSPPCTFPGIQIIRHSACRFFALSSTAGYLLSGLRQPSHPARIFSGIFPDPFYLLPARRLPAHVTQVCVFGCRSKLKALQAKRCVENNILCYARRTSPCSDDTFGQWFLTVAIPHPLQSRNRPLFQAS